MPYRVCFVCTGNICRSPMAESVFRARVAEAGLDGLIEVDSAGTGGWHEGDGADPRTVSVLEANGYDSDHTARQFRASWFSRLDLVIALDSGHLEALRRLAPTSADAEKVQLLRSYARPSPDHHPSTSALHAPSESPSPDHHPSTSALHAPSESPSPDHHPSTSASHTPSESAGHDLDVPDPYYGGMDGFEECLEMIEAASVGLLAAAQKHVEGEAA